MTLEEALARIVQLERQVATLQATEYAELAELRKRALGHGATGVTSAFALWLFVFCVTTAIEMHTKQPLKSAPDLIWLGVVLCFALVAYFAFIFGFAFTAKVSAAGGEFGAKPGSTTTTEK